MAGIARIVIGVLLILIGLPFLLFFFVGLLPIIVGIILVASGASARGDADRLLAQQRQTNALLQQQMQLTAMQTNRAPVGQYAAAPPSALTSGAPTPGQTSGFCPSCGAPAQGGAAFCPRCGKPLGA